LPSDILGDHSFRAERHLLGLAEAPIDLFKDQGTGKVQRGKRKWASEARPSVAR